LVDDVHVIKSANLGFFYYDECLKWSLNPQAFWLHSKVITTKPSPHVMTRNDIAKNINTYFEQKNHDFYFVI
jgi:hypothetical protein